MKIKFQRISSICNHKHLQCEIDIIQQQCDSESLLSKHIDMKCYHFKVKILKETLDSVLKHERSDKNQ